MRESNAVGCGQRMKSQLKTRVAGAGAESCSGSGWQRLRPSLQLKPEKTPCGRKSAAERAVSVPRGLSPLLTCVRSEGLGTRAESTDKDQRNWIGRLCVGCV